MSAAGSTGAKRSRGQSLVEFAIFIPVLVAVLLLAVDVGRAYLGWVTLTNVARIGANFAAMNPDAFEGSGEPTVQARYRTLMAKDATGIDCTLDSPLPAPTFPDGTYTIGSRVGVNLNCKFSLVTPFLSAVIGDGTGKIDISSEAIFTIRTGSTSGVVIGGDVPAPTPTPTVEPTPTDTPRPTATPTDTPDPTATVPGSTPGPTAEPTPTASPTIARIVSFYGTPTSDDAFGGGPPGSEFEDLITGVDPLTVIFEDTSVGPPKSACVWDWGDGTTSTSCGNQVTHLFDDEGWYTVSLTIDGTTHTRSLYVLVACKVPAFSGVRKNDADGLWSAAGFDTSNITYLDGPGNYKIGYQSLAGGLVNPSGGCDAEITLGP